MKYEGGLESMTGAGYVNSNFWSDFIGGGTFDITAEIAQVANYGGIGGIAVSILPMSADGEVSVTYNYVPEPASMLLLSIGAPLLLRIRRKK